MQILFIYQFKFQTTDYITTIAMLGFNSNDNNDGNNRFDSVIDNNDIFFIRNGLDAFP